MTALAPNHLPLEHLKIVFFRQCVDRAFADVYAPASHPREGGQTKELASLHRQLLTVAQNDSVTRDNAVTLSQSYRSLLSRAEYEINRSPLTRALKELLVATLIAGGASVSCRKCAEIADAKPCTGSGHDSHVVESSGQCLTEFRRAFEWARRNAREFYLQHANSKLLLERVDDCIVRLDTASTNNKPHNLAGLDYRISAVSNYEDATGTHQCTVTLKVQTLELDWSSVLASVHVFAHECVVHAFQGIDRRSAERRAMAWPEEAFSEGWMEHITFDRVQAWDRPHNMHGCRKHSERLHNAKCVHRDGKGSEKTERCILGRALAIKFRDSVVRSLSKNFEYDFLSISARINLASIDGETRTDFVYAVNYLLNSRDEEKAKSLISLTRQLLTNAIDARQFVLLIVRESGVDGIVI